MVSSHISKAMQTRLWASGEQSGEGGCSGIGTFTSCQPLRAHAGSCININATEKYCLLFFLTPADWSKQNKTSIPIGIG